MDYFDNPQNNNNGTNQIINEETMKQTLNQSPTPSIMNPFPFNTVNSFNMPMQGLNSLSNNQPNNNSFPNNMFPNGNPLFPNPNFQMNQMNQNPYNLGLPNFQSQIFGVNGPMNMNQMNQAQKPQQPLLFQNPLGANNCLLIFSFIYF